AGRGGGDGRLREASRGATGPRGGITSGMKGASGVRNEGDVMSSEPQYETIIVEKERGRARITLNRPEKLNALSRQLQRELREALWEADRDNRVHCVILRGAGRSFCAGYDLTPE